MEQLPAWAREPEFAQIGDLVQLPKDEQLRVFTKNHDMWLPLREQLLSLIDYGLHFKQLLELGLNEAVVLTCTGDLATSTPDLTVKLEATGQHESDIHPVPPSLATGSLPSPAEPTDDMMDISPILPEGDLFAGQLPNRSRSPLHTMTTTEISGGVGGNSSAFDAGASAGMETEAVMDLLRPASPEADVTPFTSPERTQLPRTSDLIGDEFNSDMEFDDDGDCFPIVDGVWETLRDTGYMRPRPSAAELNGQPSFRPTSIFQPPVLFAEVPQNYVIDLSDSEYEDEERTAQSSSGTLEKNLLSDTVQERMEELDRQKRELLSKLKAMAAKRKKTIVQNESPLCQPKTMIPSEPPSRQPESVTLKPILEEPIMTSSQRASPLLAERTAKPKEVPSAIVLPAVLDTSAAPASSSKHKAESIQRKRKIQLKRELLKEERALALAQKDATILQSELVKLAHVLQKTQSTRIATSASLAAAKAKLEHITRQIKQQETAVAALDVVERDSAQKITDQKRQLLLQSKSIPDMHQSINTKRAEILQLDKSVRAFRPDGASAVVTTLPQSRGQSTNVKCASDNEGSRKGGPTKRAETRHVALSNPDVLAPAATLTSPSYDADLLRFLKNFMLSLNSPETRRLVQDAIPVSFPIAVRDEAIRSALNPPETLIPLMALDGLLRTEADLASISDVYNSALNWSWTLNGWWNAGTDSHGRSLGVAASSSLHKGRGMLPPFQSNLPQFRSFRVSTECHENVTSLTWSNKVNALQILCRYEMVGGICPDPLCQGQHMRDITMTDDEITHDLLSYTSNPADHSAIAANLDNGHSKDNPFEPVSQADLATAWILYFHLCHRGSLPERAFLTYPYDYLTRREFWEIAWQTPKVRPASVHLCHRGSLPERAFLTYPYDYLTRREYWEIAWQTPKVRPASLTGFHLLFYNVVISWSKNVDMNNLLPFVAVLRNFLTLWTPVLGQQDTLLKLMTAVQPLLQSVELIDLFCGQWELTDDPRMSLRGAGLAAQKGHNFGLWNCYTKLAFRFGNFQDVLKALVNCARAAYVGLDEVTDVSQETTAALAAETLDLYRKVLFLPVSSLRSPDVLPELSRSATKANVFLWISYLMLASLRPSTQEAAIDISGIFDHALEAVRDPSGRQLLWMEYIRFQTASKPPDEALTTRNPSVRDNLTLVARAAKEMELNTKAHPAIAASPSYAFMQPAPWKDINGLQRLLELLMNAYGKEKRDELIEMVVDGQLPLGISPL
ncbi:hypothetical protein HKX48_000536 [Thoreauomyces humboldtii]|nr:hypothetical protein HKX48_000536 [Thoreauomyces humboldtii]